MKEGKEGEAGKEQTFFMQREKLKLNTLLNVDADGADERANLAKEILEKAAGEKNLIRV
jgi:hypothetical protein